MPSSTRITNPPKGISLDGVIVELHHSRKPQSPIQRVFPELTLPKSHERIEALNYHRHLRLPEIGRLIIAHCNTTLTEPQQRLWKQMKSSHSFEWIENSAIIDRKNQTLIIYDSAKGFSWNYHRMDNPEEGGYIPKHFRKTEPFHIFAIPQRLFQRFEDHFNDYGGGFLGWFSALDLGDVFLNYMFGCKKKDLPNHFFLGDQVSKLYDQIQRARTPQEREKKQEQWGLIGSQWVTANMALGPYGKLQPMYVSPSRTRFQTVSNPTTAGLAVSRGVYEPLSNTAQAAIGKKLKRAA